MPLGSTLDEQASFKLMDRYVELGGNMVDTAEVYANWLPGEKSISEKVIGRWMKARGNREQLIVTTKGVHHDLDAPTIVPRVAYAPILTDIEASL